MFTEPVKIRSWTTGPRRTGMKVSVAHSRRAHLFPAAPPGHSTLMTESGMWGRPKYRTNGLRVPLGKTTDRISTNVLMNDVPTGRQVPGGRPTSGPRG
jgi:hypothetical protein